MLTAVDLAAKFSAACHMDEDSNVVDQFDSWQLSEDQFLDRIVEKLQSRHPYDVLIIEDIPHALFRGGATGAKTIKKVCHIQGRIEEKLIQSERREWALWVAPAVWMRSYGIKTSKDAAKLVQPKAEELGYTPPLDYTIYKGKDRATARKVNTDYCASYLIGRWANTYFKEHGTYDAPETSRFITNG